MINRLPTVKSTIQTDDSTVFALDIDKDIPCVEGHFPDISIVPGVAQVDWVMQLARQHLGLTETFAGMDALKFQQLLRPGMSCLLTLQWQSEKGQLRFSFSSDDGVFSSGRINLAVS